MDTTIIVNGTAFTGEMILNAVKQTTGFPEFGIETNWNPHQLVESQEYDSIKQEMLNYRMDLIKEGKIRIDSPCCNILEKNLGGWRFLYDSDGRGDWHTTYFSF